MSGGSRASRANSVALLALIAWVTVPAANGAKAPLALAEYQARLRTARAAAWSARASLNDSRQAAALRRRMVALLPSPAQVRLSSGKIIPVDNQSLFAALSTRSAVVGRIRFISAVDRLLAATALPAPSLDRPRIDRVLGEVLRRPEYRTPENKDSAIERFILWLSRLLDRLMPAPARRAVGGGDRLARLMVIIVVLLLAALVVRVLFLVWPDLRRRPRREAEAPAGELLVPQEPDALWAAAEREAAAGRYREALRLAYRALVVRLDRAAVLPEDGSRTGWELLRELRRRASDELKVASDELKVTSDELKVTGDEAGKRPLVTRYSSLVTLFSPLIGRLDERLYGGRTATADDYEACRRAYQEIERLLCLPA